MDKTIDYPTDEDELPTWQRTWFLKLLSKEESIRLQQLSDVKRAFLRLLHECETEKKLGAIREQDALQKLEELGFSVKKVPWIPDKLSTFYERENGKPVIWYYLTPQDELSEDFKTMMKEADRKEGERQHRVIQSEEQDE